MTKIVAANVKVTEARSLVEGFGFQYSSVSNNDFASFIKIGSTEEIGGKLSFEYFCSLIDASVSAVRSLAVSCGEAGPITLIPGRSVEYDDLGIVSDGVYKVNVCFDNSTTCSVLINVVNNRSFTVRKTQLLNTSDTVSFSFTLYNAAASKWTINWGDGSEAGVFDKLSSTLTAPHIYESEGDYRIVVQAVVGEENVFFYNVASESINFDGAETGDDNAAALLDESFASDDLFLEYFV